MYICVVLSCFYNLRRENKIINAAFDHMCSFLMCSDPIGIQSCTFKGEKKYTTQLFVQLLQQSLAGDNQSGTPVHSTRIFHLFPPTIAANGCMENCVVCCGLKFYVISLHTEVYFRNLIKSTRIQIVFTIF